MKIISASLQNIAARVASLEIWAAGGVVALSVASERLLPLTVLVLALFWPVRWLASGKLTRRTAIDIPVLVLISLLPITLWVTPLPAVTLPQVLRLLTGIGLYYSIVNWTTSLPRLRWLVYGVAAAVVGLALVGLFSVDWAPDKLPLFSPKLFALLPTLPGERIQRTVMGGYLMLLIPVAAGVVLFAFKQLSMLEITGFVVSILVAGSVLLLTLARGAFLGLAVAMLLLGILRWAGSLKKVWWLGILGLAAAVFWVGIDRLINFFNDSPAFSGISGRLEIYSRALMIIHDFPFTGIGMGTFGPVVDTLYPFFSISAGVIPHAHNLFLQLAVDLGIPGLLAWLAACLLSLALSLKLFLAAQRHKQVWLAGLGAGLFAAQVAMLTQGLMDAVMWGMVRPAPLVWMVWGMTAAAWSIMQAVQPTARA